VGNPTAILSALAQEQQGLIEQLEGPRQVQRAGRAFWLGRLQGREVSWRCRASARWPRPPRPPRWSRPSTRGASCSPVWRAAWGRTVQIGDLVVADAFVQHDMDASPLFPRFEIPLYGQTALPAMPSCREQLAQACRASLGAGRPHARPACTGPDRQR
jgi:adenosylhomocysteine nucleosidase